MTRFLRILVRIVLDNRKAVAEIVELETLRFAFAAILIRWGFTWVTTVIAYLMGREPFVEPYVRISAESYYFYEMFFLVPYGVALWIFVAGVAQILMIVLKGRGTFKDTLTYYAFTACALLPVFWIADLLAIVFNLWVQPVIIPIHIIAAILEATLYAIGLSNLHQLPLKRTIIPAIVSMIVYRPLAVILIR